MKSLLISLIAFVSACALAQEPEGNASSKSKAPKAADALQVNEFAKTGMVGSVVGITLDDRGRVYVTQTNRRNNAELDIRKNKDWLLDSLALTSPEDRQALIKKRMPDTWRDLANFKEQIIRVEDTDGDGRADKRTVVFEGLNELGSGLAAGILWHDGALYVTCMPSLWKLTDKDGDGLFETKQELVRGIGYHIGYGGHDMHGPTLGPDGRIYWTTGDKGVHVKLADGRDIHLPGQGGCFRIETDGSGFEVFAHGLRNSQELAFDEWGNLFTVDNDGDFGDKERVIHIVEGADYAWRMQYQYRSDRSWGQMAGYNPWLSDNLWKAPEPGMYQPAYLTPALANFSVGPIGLEYNPGTALSEKWRGTFFLAESSKDVQAFNLEPAGANFTFVNPRPVVTGPFITGIFFGPDGALYGANWGENAWAPHDKGNVLKLDTVESERDTQREGVRVLIGEDFTKRSTDDLAGLLGHADQRIRWKAQFELVKRGDAGLKALQHVATDKQAVLARVHAIWGLGQLGRHDPVVAALLMPLFQDQEIEVRAQASRMLGDAHHEAAATDLAKLLSDASPRVRAFVGIALRNCGTPAQCDAAVTMLAQNNDVDLVLRHAGAMAIAGCARADRTKIASLATHSSKAVRSGAVIAARLSLDEGASAFLKDGEISIVSEAARAIHDDLSISSALPALAAVIERAGLTDEATLRRGISANIRVGDDACALRLLTYAQNKAAPVAMRAEALETLALWPVGLGYDRVSGFYRGLKARGTKALQTAFAQAFDSLIVDPAHAVQSATARVVRALNYKEGIDKLTTIALDEKADAEMRAIALETMSVARAPKLAEAIALFSKSEVSAMRIASVRAQAELKADAKETFAAIDALLQHGSVPEQQAMLALLGSMKASGAETMLGKWLDNLAKGKIAPEIALDVYEAGVAFGGKTLKKAVGKVDSAMKKQTFGVWSLALHGGDAEEGKAIFSGSTTAACMQCHTMLAGLPSVGPDLSKVATRLTPEHLLRAVVDPQSEIAEGYGLISVTLKNGSVQSGLLAKETKDELTLRLPATTITSSVKKADIVNRTKPASAMPTMTSLLTKMEVRNIVAYLQTLK